MAELRGVPNGSNCVSNQVLYHLGSRGIEWELLDALRRRHNVMVMAYSPLGQGAVLRKPALRRSPTSTARRRRRRARLGLRHEDVVAIPKASNPEHVQANCAPPTSTLDADDLKALDAAFPPPKRAHAAGYDLSSLSSRPERSGQSRDRQDA